MMWNRLFKRQRAHKSGVECGVGTTDEDATYANSIVCKVPCCESCHKPFGEDRHVFTLLPCTHDVCQYCIPTDKEHAFPCSVCTTWVDRKMRVRALYNMLNIPLDKPLPEHPGVKIKHRAIKRRHARLAEADKLAMKLAEIAIMRAIDDVFACRSILCFATTVECLDRVDRTAIVADEMETILSSIFPDIKWAGKVKVSIAFDKSERERIGYHVTIDCMREAYDVLRLWTPKEINAM